MCVALLELGNRQEWDGETSDIHRIIGKKWLNGERGCEKSKGVGRQKDSPALSVKDRSVPCIFWYDILVVLCGLWVSDLLYTAILY